MARDSGPRVLGVGLGSFPESWQRGAVLQSGRVCDAANYQRKRSICLGLGPRRGERFQDGSLWCRHQPHSTAASCESKGAAGRMGVGSRLLVPHPPLPRPVGVIPRVACQAATETNRKQRMKPRPFYRWKSFWLGLCVSVALGWAWWDNTHSRTFFDFRLASSFNDPRGSLFISDKEQYRRIFLFFLGLWSAWLFWHWKREQKKLSP